MEKPNAQQRVLRIIPVMAGHELDGIAPGGLAKKLQTTPSNISRDLRILQSEGFVELVPGLDNRWRLSPKMIQIARSHMMGIERMEARLKEVEQRYSRDF